MSKGMRGADTEKSLLLKMASTPVAPRQAKKVVDDSASSDYASSIYLEKEQAQKQSKWKSLVNKIKSIEPPEPVIPNSNRSSMPAWAAL